jgi:hypothetical protein
MRHIFLFVLIFSVHFSFSQNLNEDSDTMRSEEVNIKVFRNSRSRQAMNQDIKSAGLVMNGLSAETIGVIQVNNASDAVKKISGVNVMDDGKLVIRGVSPRYNVVMLDNFKAPSFDPDIRMFSLDVLPSAVLDNIKVLKSASAEYPADFCGGIVNIETLSLPDKNQWKFSFSMGGDFQTLGQKFFVQDNKGKNLFGLNPGINDLPNDWKDRRIDESDISVAERKQLTSEFNDNYFPIELKSQLVPNFNFRILRTNRVKVRNGFFGSSHMFVVENRHENRVLRRSSLRTIPDISRTLNFSDNNFTTTNRVSLLNNFTYGNKTGFRADFKTLLVNNAEFNVLNRQGYALPGNYGENGIYEYISFKQYSSSNVYRRFLISSLNLSKDFNNGKFKIEGGGSMNLSRFLDLDRKNALLTRDDSPLGNTTTFDFRKEYAFIMDQLKYGRWFYSLPEDALQGRLDFTYKVNESSSFKTGLRLDQTKRDFDLRCLGMVNSTWTDTVDSHTGVLIDEYTWPYNSYEATLTTNAGFVQYNYSGKKWNINTGVRYEYTNFTLRSEGFELKYNTGEIVRKSNNFFPSLNVTYKINPAKQIRFAAGKTCNRPELREFSPLEYLDIKNWLEAYGNASLKPVSVVDNFEIRYETYAKNLTLNYGLFYKNIHDPVIGKIQGQNAFIFSNYHNSITYGGEIELQKMIKLRSKKYFERIELMMNFSYNISLLFENQGTKEKDSIVLTKTPMIGQSPYVINAQITGIFPKNKGYISISGFYQGDRYLIAGTEIDFFSIIQKTGFMLNITSNYNIKKNIDLRFKVDNVLNVSDILYNDVNANGSLQFYNGYINSSAVTGDNIFAHRRDPCAVSLGVVWTLD